MAEGHLSADLRQFLTSFRRHSFPFRSSLRRFTPNLGRIVFCRNLSLGRTVVLPRPYTGQNIPSAETLYWAEYSFCRNLILGRIFVLPKPYSGQNSRLPIPYTGRISVLPKPNRISAAYMTAETFCRQHIHLSNLILAASLSAKTFYRQYFHLPKLLIGQHVRLPKPRTRQNISLPSRILAECLSAEPFIGRMSFCQNLLASSALGISCRKDSLY